MATIYIVSPKKFTGGPESLHQLGQALLKHGLDVRMYYTDGFRRFKIMYNYNILDKRLSIYHIPDTKKIEDSAENILIVPEIWTGFLSDFIHIKKCIWWLSYDYFFSSTPRCLISQSKKTAFLPSWMYWLPLLYFKIKGSYSLPTYRFDLHGDSTYHMYNCESVNQLLYNNSIRSEQLLYLCGPLDDVYFECALSNERNNIILYNPKKGRGFTEKILSKANEIGLDAIFIPLQGMTAEQIVQLMSKAKIYMDFGPFPGPERIPREAVIMGCNIITSTLGCAANNIDVPIPKEFKYDVIDSNIESIVYKLKYMLENYIDLYHLYDEYRKKVVLQRDQFNDGVLTFMDKFNLK